MADGFAGIGIHLTLVEGFAPIWPKSHPFGGLGTRKQAENGA
jgi:hypothetical protein